MALQSDSSLDDLISFVSHNVGVNGKVQSSGANDARYKQTLMTLRTTLLHYNFSDVGILSELTKRNEILDELGINFMEKDTLKQLDQEYLCTFSKNGSKNEVSIRNIPDPSILFPPAPTHPVAPISDQPLQASQTWSVEESQRQSATQSQSSFQSYFATQSFTQTQSQSASQKQSEKRQKSQEPSRLAERSGHMRRDRGAKYLAHKIQLEELDEELEIPTKGAKRAALARKGRPENRHEKWIRDGRPRLTYEDGRHIKQWKNIVKDWIARFLQQRSDAAKIPSLNVEAEELGLIQFPLTEPGSESGLCYCCGATSSTTFNKITVAQVCFPGIENAHEKELCTPCSHRGLNQLKQLTIFTCHRTCVSQFVHVPSKKVLGKKKRKAPEGKDRGSGSESDGLEVKPR